MLGAVCITDKIREAKLRWYGHVMSIYREDENCMERIMTAEVNGRRSRERQKKRWGDIIQQDIMKTLRLYICLSLSLSIYIYIYRERERERETGRQRDRE